ncbi:MAG: tRNA pseudouridine(13) synthase TruD [Phycisphaerae bacterium]|jgi:tRNA pseudouridine13 synthase|nr:tRNA pseudouridine(13) synthase TruD [Phycisphaerae bacterium]
MQPDASNLPYLTADLPGAGGLIKQHIGDFCVEEIPLYPVCGEGTHVYFTVRKRGIPTPAAVARIAKYMQVRPSEIGVAGLKDAQAVTIQQMSLEHADPRKLAAFRDRQIDILSTARHTNKLRPGHLEANRFTIKVRNTASDALARAEAILEVLARRGVPNYFGPQRFGLRNDTAMLGRALVTGDLGEFVAILFGRPADSDPKDCRAARAAFDQGDIKAALTAWPRHYAHPRRALSAYKNAKASRKNERAVYTVDKRMKRLYVSALQSAIFNDVLARRIGTFDSVAPGDLAARTGSKSVFTVEAAPEQLEAEQARAAAFEISPTGPIPGYRSSLAEGEPGKMEVDALAAWGVETEDFRHVDRMKVKGARRALRFKIADLEISTEVDDTSSHLLLKFTAPSGCYATVLLDELTKNRNEQN